MCVEDAWLALGNDRTMNSYICQHCGAIHNGHSADKAPRHKGLTLLRDVIAYAKRKSFIDESQRKSLNKLLNHF